MLDYSQHGQALIIEQLLTPDTPKQLVDIGAHDGITGSNSRALVERGWSAVLIEPLPAAFALLRENCRAFPQTTLLQVACSERAGSAVLRVGVDGEGGQMSSLSASSAIAGHLTADAIEIKTLTIEEIFRAGGTPVDFGLLLVDTEGLDFEVLKGLGAALHRPRIIVTEDFAETDGEKYALLSGLEYNFVGVWGADSIWVARSHAVKTASLRLPIHRVPADWRPSGAAMAGRAYFESITRQCVVGWAFCEATDVPPIDLVVELRAVNSPQRYLFRAARVPRPDVAAHFRRPGLWGSGVRAVIDVPPGEYEIRVIQAWEGAFAEVVLSASSIA